MIGFVVSSGPTRSNPANAKFSIRAPSVCAGPTVRTGDQIRELLLESQAILREPLEFLWCDYLDGGIDNLSEGTVVSVQGVRTECW